MAGVFRAVGYTLLLALCGTSMILGQGACMRAGSPLVGACRHYLTVSPLLLGVRVAAAQSEDPLVDEGLEEEEEEADVEVEEEEVSDVEVAWRYAAGVPGGDEDVLICQSHETELCD